MTLADRQIMAIGLAEKLMLAHDFDPTRYENRPYCVQPKLDGIRALYSPHVGFVSRQGVLWPDTLTAHIKLNCPYILDGEFYCHEMPFQDIMSCMTPTRSSPTEFTQKIKYYVFDVLNYGSTLRDRMQKLDVIQTKGMFHDNVELVTGRVYSCFNTMAAAFQGYVGQGYEGAMVKNPDSCYFPGRSYDWLKWKAWQERIYTCTGVAGGQGKYEKTLGSLVFFLDGKRTFNCSGMTDAERDDIWHNYNKYAGRQAKVKYLTLSKEGVPLKPSFVSWI